MVAMQTYNVGLTLVLLDAEALKFVTIGVQKIHTFHLSYFIVESNLT